ncbi:hypothetical protein EON81_17560 [bacterium]|nr:MAG: hypothetical protein EON81_17560 [bacterium]
MKHLRVFVFPPLVALVAGASAQLDAPTLQAGRFVYAIPDSFAPPLIERAGMAEMNREIARLKFPFYVFLVKELPGRGELSRFRTGSSQFNSLRDRLTDEQTISLTNALRSQSLFDQNKGSVFLLSFDPRSFTYRPGSLWKTKYGFANLNGNNPHAPYLDLFKQYASKPANDPKQGILEMAKAIDAHLDDISNPAKIAARDRAAAIQKYESRVSEAKVALEQAYNLNVPTGSLESAIGTAEGARDGDLAALMRATETLAREVAPIYKAVSQIQIQMAQQQAEQLAVEQARQRAEDAERAKKVNSILFGIFAVGGVLGTIIHRRRRYSGLRTELDGAVAEKRSQISNAGQQAYRMFQERDTVAGASKFEGQTKRVYDRIASDLDAITIGLEAMTGHANAAEKMGAKGSWLSYRPLIEAVNFLKAPFDFDTGKVNRSDLFGDPTEIIRVEPDRFSKEMQNRFAGTSEAWERLKTAMDLQARPLEEALPHTRWTELQTEAVALGLSPALMAGHPLAGDEASDRAFFARLNTLVWQDPISTFDAIEQAKRWEMETANGFATIRQVKEDLEKARLESVPVFDTAPVSPKDDPADRLSEARQAEEAFAEAIADSDSTAEIVAKGEIALAAYARCQKAIETLQSAIENAERDIVNLDAPLREAEGRLKLSQEAVAETARFHTGVNKAKSYVHDASLSLETARKTAENARHALAERRHLDATRLVATSRERLLEVGRRSGEALHLCDELEEVRREYELQVRQTEALRARLDQEAQRYGRRNLFSSYRTPHYSGPQDYGVLIGMLSSQQSTWQNWVDDARQTHEAQQAAERQSSSSSWSSDSSSSSYSSGDSSSSFSSDSGSSSSGSGDSSGGW